MPCCKAILKPILIITYDTPQLYQQCFVGATSKPNRRFAGGCFRFRTVSIVITKETNWNRVAPLKGGWVLKSYKPRPFTKWWLKSYGCKGTGERIGQIREWKNTKNNRKNVKLYQTKVTNRFIGDTTGVINRYLHF